MKPVTRVKPGRMRQPWLPGERLIGASARRQHGVDSPTVGVLALQGDVYEHVTALERIGADPIIVKRAEELATLQGIVLPGGESTTMGKLLDRFGLLVPLRQAISDGLPTFGTCAGMILLSDELVEHPAQLRLGGLAVRTRRNAFGRQRESFDTSITVSGVDGGPMDVSFIRAPRVEALLSDEVAVLATVDGYPVVVEQANILATAFHPEVTGDDRLHSYFVERVRQYANRP